MTGIILNIIVIKITASLEARTVSFIEEAAAFLKMTYASITVGKDLIISEVASAGIFISIPEKFIEKNIDSKIPRTGTLMMESSQTDLITDSNNLRIKIAYTERPPKPARALWISLIFCH